MCFFLIDFNIIDQNYPTFSLAPRPRSFRRHITSRPTMAARHAVAHGRRTWGRISLPGGFWAPGPRPSLQIVCNRISFLFRVFFPYLEKIAPLRASYAFLFCADRLPPYPKAFSVLLSPIFPHFFLICRQVKVYSNRLSGVDSVRRHVRVG